MFTGCQSGLYANLNLRKRKQKQKMQFQLKHEVQAKCHPEDVWHVFSQIEDWHKLTDVFGNAGWVEGTPWNAGSRFFLELLYPVKVDLEVLVVKCDAPSEVVFLPHGGGYASQQWIRIRPDGYG